VLVTAGPTHEPIDPVRYIANRSSGLQGFAIAEAAARRARGHAGGRPGRSADAAGRDAGECGNRAQMAAAVEAALPADVAVMVAAVADWRVADAGAQKIKKDGSGNLPRWLWWKTPIFWPRCAGRRAPALVVGFAAETMM
jgi:phosphopantothenoylcysteine decarboxylase/phosphopantothenate--cysteine ligase